MYKTYELYGECLRGTPFENIGNDAVQIPYSTDLSFLAQKMNIGEHTVSNRITYQPMEGQDGDGEGAPSELTFKRYQKLARGGAGIIWIEATAICREGMSNPWQLMITETNADIFARLAEMIKNECLSANGYEPLLIIQLNHSGRYSKPYGKKAPMAAYINPDIDIVPSEYPSVADDDYLDSLADKFVLSAKLAIQAGFDGVDIKCCHSYLFSELLSAFERKGRYGGLLANRARLLLDTAAAMDSVLPAKAVRACRLNVYDGYMTRLSYAELRDGEDIGAAPAAKHGMPWYDLTEPYYIIDKLRGFGLSLLNVTMGSPYRNPDVSRPYRRGLQMPKTDAIAACFRLFSGASEIHAKYDDIKCVCTGTSMFGKLAPYAAAGLISEDMTDLTGFGRMSFAYPQFAADVLGGSFDPHKICVSCSGCSILKANLYKSGCVIRDEMYKELYRQYKNK